MSLEKRAHMFDDGAATPAAKAVTTAYTETSGDQWHKAGAATHLRVVYTLSGTAPTTLKMKLLGSYNGGTSEYPEPGINSVVGGEVDSDDLVCTLPVTAAVHSSPRIPIDPGIDYSIEFIRTGGDATTEVIAEGLFTGR